MKIYQAGKQCSIDALVEEYKEALKKDIVVLLTEDHLRHIAAYAAWQSVGGRIQIINPLLTDIQKAHLRTKAQESHYNNCVFMHTSGTTGLPKLVVHTLAQFKQVVTNNAVYFGHNSSTHYFSVFPASTSAFWHIVIAPLYHFNSTVTLSSVSSLEDDIDNESYTLVVLVPAVIDYLSNKPHYLNFSNFERMVLGGGQVHKRHVEYITNAGCTNILHSFGATETGSPLLARRINGATDPEWTSLIVPEGIEVTLVDDELWVRGNSVCENHNELCSFEGWYCTGDLWEQNGSLIRFLGRKDDFVSINNINISLTDIEKASEEIGLGSVTVSKESRLGVEFLTLRYTNQDITVQQARVILRKELGKLMYPRKILQVDDVPRSVLGKKMRIK